MERIKHHKGSRLLFLLVGVLLGAVIVLGIRYYNVTKNHVHYHATFAVFIDGERQEFSEPGFYEEVVSCSEAGNDPTQRTHMHRPDNDVVHVHDNLVTWGDFFENIGFSISERHIKTNDKIYITNDQSDVSFLLNGEPVRNPANIVIGDEDVLLVSYGGGSDKELQKQLETIERHKAGHANHQNDPGSCGGETNNWRHVLSELL